MGFLVGVNLAVRVIISFAVRGGFYATRAGAMLTMRSRCCPVGGNRCTGQSQSTFNILSLGVQQLNVSPRSVVPLDITVTLLGVVISAKLDAKRNRAAHGVGPAATVRPSHPSTLWLIVASVHAALPVEVDCAHMAFHCVALTFRSQALLLRRERSKRLL